MNLKLLVLLLCALHFVRIVKADEEASAEEETPAEEEAESSDDEGEEGEEKEDKDKDKPKEGEEEGDEKPKEEEAEDGAEKELVCKKPLLETFGMVGLDEAKKMDMDICTTVKHSCCHVTDQAKIYENWVDNKEGEELKNRLHYHTRVTFISTYRSDAFYFLFLVISGNE